MRSDVLRRLDLAQQFLGVAADAVVMHFHDLDLAVRIDDEGAAIGQALLLDQHLEIARQRRGRIADQRVLHFLDGVGGVVPGLVGEMRVGGYAVDFHAQFLEFGVVVGEVAEFGRADEGEIRGVEHERRTTCP